jgi:hypothetical protein
MHEPPVHLLHGLASVEDQRRYIVAATMDEYLLPEEILNDASHFCERATRISDTLTQDQRDAVGRLRDAVEAADIEGYDRSNVAALIEADPRWALARQRAREAIQAFGLDPPV